MREPFGEGFGAGERKDFTGAGFGVAEVGEAGEDASGFVDEWEGFVVGKPFEFGGGVAFGLGFDVDEFVPPVPKEARKTGACRACRPKDNRV